MPHCEHCGAAVDLLCFYLCSRCLRQGAIDTNPDLRQAVEATQDSQKRGRSRSRAFEARYTQQRRSSLSPQRPAQPFGHARHRGELYGREDDPDPYGPSTVRPPPPPPHYYQAEEDYCGPRRYGDNLIRNPHYESDHRQGYRDDARDYTSREAHYNARPGGYARDYTSREAQHYGSPRESSHHPAYPRDYTSREAQHYASPREFSHHPGYPRGMFDPYGMDRESNKSYEPDSRYRYARGDRMDMDDPYAPKSPGPMSTRRIIRPTSNRRAMSPPARRYNDPNRSGRDFRSQEPNDPYRSVSPDTAYNPGQSERVSNLRCSSRYFRSPSPVNRRSGGRDLTAEKANVRNRTPDITISRNETYRPNRVNQDGKPIRRSYDDLSSQGRTPAGDFWTPRPFADRDLRPIANKISMPDDFYPPQFDGGSEAPPGPATSAASANRASMKTRRPEQDKAVDKLKYCIKHAVGGHLQDSPECTNNNSARRLRVKHDYKWTVPTDHPLMTFSEIHTFNDKLNWIVLYWERNLHGFDQFVASRDDCLEKIYHGMKAKSSVGNPSIQSKIPIIDTWNRVMGRTCTLTDDLFSDLDRSLKNFRVYGVKNFLIRRYLRDNPSISRVSATEDQDVNAANAQSATNTSHRPYANKQPKVTSPRLSLKDDSTDDAAPIPIANLPEVSYADVIAWLRTAGDIPLRDGDGDLPSKLISKGSWYALRSEVAQRFKAYRVRMGILTAAIEDVCRDYFDDPYVKMAFQILVQFMPVVKPLDEELVLPGVQYPDIAKKMKVYTTAFPSGPFAEPESSLHRS